MNDKSGDLWQTPKWLFDELNKEFKFSIDLCATAENSKCLDFCEDYLKDVGSAQNTFLTWGLNLTNKNCFMNPPYSNPKPFIEKAWEDSKHCRIVCLVKCDPSTKWWATFWDYTVGPKPGCEVRFFPKRIKFVPPEGFEGKASGPSFPSALIIMNRRGL